MNNTNHEKELSFLHRIEGESMSMREILLVAPGKFLSSSIDEVELPSRLVNKLEGVKTVGDLLRYKEEDLLGKNLGVKTLESAKASLVQFFKRKVEGKDYSSLPIREQMEDYAKDLLAREARIWEMRMGLKKERFTLEATGEKFGLTRERVRQIEGVLFDTFSKRFPAVQTIRAVIKEGMNLQDLIKATDGLLNENDRLPLIGLMENLSPKFYLIEEFGEPLVSNLPRSTYETTVRQALVNFEKEFRNSETLLGEENCLEILKKHLKDTALYLAASKLTSEGRWLDSQLLSPNSDKTNLAVGLLQASPRPMHLQDLVDEIYRITKENTTPETLRSCLGLVPAVRSFGFSTVGFARHTFLNLTQAKNIVALVERIVENGPEGYQWNVKDLLVTVKEKFPNIELSYNQLNVILQDSDNLQYLGRHTWSDNTVKERTIYRDLFRSILKAAGKPLDTHTLTEEARKHRGVHFRGGVPNDPEIIEVSKGVWGLAGRDNPFTPKEIKAMLKVFDASFGEDFNLTLLHAKGINTKGLSDADLIKVLTASTK